MKKELEALDGIKKVLAKYISEKTGVSEEKHFEYLQYDTEIGLVAKALTPPTADEVCQEIISFFKKSSHHKHITTAYYSSVSKKFYAEDYPNLLEMIFDNYYLPQIPPHLITLIGRFYESLEEENDY